MALPIPAERLIRLHPAGVDTRITTKGSPLQRRTPLFMHATGGVSKAMSALARSVRLVPSLRVSTRELRTSPWAMLAVVATAGLALTALLPNHASDAIVNPMGGVIGVAAVGGLRRSLHKAAFNLLSAGVVMYATADVVGLLASSPGSRTLAFGLFLIAYTAMAAGLAVFVGPRPRRHRRRRRRH